MSARTYRFDSGGLSHVGRVRDHNEDRLLVAPDIGVWLVADGMGGHFGGEVAAQLIVDHVGTVNHAATAPDLMARFVDRLDRANGAIRDHSVRNDNAMIGATVAGLLVHDGGFAAVWCGDSRVYLLRDGQLSQLTRDHTEVQELLDTGAITPEEAENWPRKNVITRAVGVRAQPQLDHVYGTLRDRDRFVICSDGLTGHVDDHEIAGLLQGSTPQAACDALLDLTLQRGASDNVTIVVVRCEVKTLVGAPDAWSAGAKTGPGGLQ